MLIIFFQLYTIIIYMKTKFQFTRKNLLRLIINELIFLLIPFIVIYFIDTEIYIIGLLIAYGVLSFIFLPPFILFTEYYLKNRNMYFEFSNDEFSVYKKGKENKTIPFSQIKKVISVDSVHYEKKRLENDSFYRLSLHHF